MRRTRLAAIERYDSPVMLLEPWSAVIAGTIAIPALLLLYFLKLRRLPRRVPSTLLWAKSIDDLQVNAPFQRLRWSLLLLLQLLTVLLLVLALGRPVIDDEPGGSTRHILLIDRSASMSARDGEGAADPDSPTRLDQAKVAARQIIDRLASSGDPTDVMVIAFGATARVVAPFQAASAAAADAVDSIQPTDEPGDLAAALRLADAYASGSPNEDTDLPIVTLISDGAGASGRPTGESLAVRAASFRYVRIGPVRAAPLEGEDTARTQFPSPGSGVDNLGIAALTARRAIDDPSSADVFIRLVNASNEERTTSILVSVDGRAEATIEARVPGCSDTDPPLPGEFLRTVRIALPEGGLVTASLRRADALDSDNAASILLPPPRTPRIALVHGAEGADEYLRRALEAAAPDRVVLFTDIEFASLPTIDRESGADEVNAFDLVVFDRVARPQGVSAPTLTLGAAPPGVEIVPTADDAGVDRFVSWDRSDPLLRHVDLEDIVYAPFGYYRVAEELSDAVRVLASGTRGAAMIAEGSIDEPHVSAGMILGESTWPTKVGLLIFVQNLLDTSRRLREATSGIAHRTGEVITLAPEAGRDTLSVTGPSDLALEVEGRARLALPALSRAGIYRVEGAAPPHDRLAVNLADEKESDIRVAAEIRVNAEAARGIAASDAALRELWPWLAAAALGLLALEWAVYLRRANS